MDEQVDQAILTLAADILPPMSATIGSAPKIFPR